MELRSKKVLKPPKYPRIRFSKNKDIKYYFVSSKEKKDKMKCYEKICKINDV